MSAGDTGSRRNGGDRCVSFVATGGGVGLIPFAPGTWGSLEGAALVALCHWAFPHPAVLPLLACLLFFAGVPLCRRASRLWGRPDPGAVIFDEIAAIFVVYSLVPLTWVTVVTGVLLFRLFDIAKPGPVRMVERWPHGWGIMADDLVAALLAGGILWGVRFLGG